MEESRGIVVVFSCGGCLLSRLHRFASGEGRIRVCRAVNPFIGASDDWTAPQPCIDLAAKLAAVGEPVTITVYPDTYHGFDGPATQGRLRLEVPNGVNPGKGVTVAPNPVARADAYGKLKVFLRAQLGGEARIAGGSG